MSLRYPFSAISGQDELLLALLLTAVDPLIGGLLACYCTACIAGLMVR